MGPKSFYQLYFFSSVITDATISTTIDRLIYQAMLVYQCGIRFVIDICCIRAGQMVIHDVSDLRQSLSDELHARAFYDFEGAGRFIRFVYLVGNDDSASSRALPVFRS